MGKHPSVCQTPMRRAACMGDQCDMQREWQGEGGRIREGRSEGQGMGGGAWLDCKDANPGFVSRSKLINGEMKILE